MSKKLCFKRIISLILASILLFGGSVQVLASDAADDVTYINLFDPDDPNLISVEDISEQSFARMNTRPTRRYNIDESGIYNYSLSAVGTTISWTSYIFETLDYAGHFAIVGSAGTSGYTLVVVNASTSKQYTYYVAGTSFSCNDTGKGLGVTLPTFYFGFRTTSGKVVSVSGAVDTY